MLSLSGNVEQSVQVKEQGVVTCVILSWKRNSSSRQVESLGVLIMIFELVTNLLIP